MTKKNDKELKGEATLDRIGGLVVDLINGEADKDGLSELEREIARQFRSQILNSCDRDLL